MKKRAFQGASTISTNTQPPEGSSPTVGQLLEALLFMGGAPLTTERAAQAIRGLSPSQFTEAIQTLSREYQRQGRPYGIHLQDNGYVLKLRSEFKSIEERLYGLNRQARLSSAAIDVLSLVAYRQPVSKQDIDGIRGSDSGGILRQLLRRGLVRVTDRQEKSGREIFYATTPRFLELFQLNSLDELPQTQDLASM
jgi:segregation and condensation protein B